MNYYDTLTVAAVPVNVGCDTEPAGVYVALIVASVPEKVGLDTDPAGVYVAVAFPAVPVNDAVRLAPVPVNEAVPAVTVSTPVATVVDELIVGNAPASNVPAIQPIVKV